MPARSEKQRRFFYLVKALQTGKLSPKQVGSKVTKAAKHMSSKSVDDFIHNKPISKKDLKEIIDDLRYYVAGSSNGRDIGEPMFLEEEDDYTKVSENPIAKTFQQTGNFQQYVDRFTGLEFKPKELEAVNSYQKTKPSEISKAPVFYIKYENTDDFNVNTTTIIKKLRDGNNLVFTSFQKTSNPGGETEEEQDTIIVNKSKSFVNDIDGGKILANMLEKLEI